MKWDEYGEIIRVEDYVIAETTVLEEEKKIKIVSLNDERMRKPGLQSWSCQQCNVVKF